MMYYPQTQTSIFLQYEKLIHFFTKIIDLNFRCARATYKFPQIDPS
jgi:hypothetical protein